MSRKLDDLSPLVGFTDNDAVKTDTLAPSSAAVIYPQYYGARIYQRGVMLDLFGYTGDVPDPEPGEKSVQSTVGLSWSHVKGLAQFMVALVEKHEHEHGTIEVAPVPPARHQGIGEKPH